MRNQTPVHEPALVAAFVTDDNGNVGRSLGGDVKAGRGAWEIVIQVPANSDITKFDHTY